MTDRFVVFGKSLSSRESEYLACVEGLEVHALLDETQYENGVVVIDQELS
jgi:hypothetical protein